jgi:hypothetical protein
LSSASSAGAAVPAAAGGAGAFVVIMIIVLVIYMRRKSKQVIPKWLYFSHVDGVSLTLFFVHACSLKSSMGSTSD